MDSKEVPIEIQKGFFFPVCNKSEIERVFNVQNAKDHLLKIRAETIVDHMRLFRVYRNKAIANPKNWSLEKSFSNLHYEKFLSHLNKENKENCKEITYGNIFSNQVSGLIFKSPYGTMINISDSIRFFLKFMNLGLLNFQTEVPLYVRVNAIRIAIRVMLQSEALDFYMDPRGIVPKNVGILMEKDIPNELLFIAGHEFSHHLCGHLSDENVIEKPIFRGILENQEDYKPIVSYTQTQIEEFEADLVSIELPKYSNSMKKAVLEGALTWFMKLDIYEHFIGICAPSTKFINREHPPASKRFDMLLNQVEFPKNFNKEYWQDFKKDIEKVKMIIEDDARNNLPNYQFYGSLYLDEPNSKWRGKELIDRVDYY
ncbi:M48 family metalloprotease [Flavobacterium soyangense]|uniref:Uncharacterized protein n=1 Tax=Flavobacterium soyangense TaxID=2023265 RepID=A0A930XVV7_9FLAO|nr:hypothetical protein [Flavobacterium soyangense]MBF2710070.1 hypothetical protein [Flavobacterium soyangense]